MTMKGGHADTPRSFPYTQHVFLPFVFQPLPLGSIKPSGWLLNEMQQEADGLAGHMHDFFRYVSQSTWTGGTQEYSALNEGFPYWFNGMVPLAYGLDDDRIKGQVHDAVTYVLSHQQSDGWIGPETGNARNFWARYPFFLGLIGLVEADSSYRTQVLNALHSFFKLMNSMLHDDYAGYLYKDGDKVGSFDTSWGRVRLCDMLITLQWMLENDPRNQSSILIDNMQLMLNEQLDWASWYQEDVYPTQDLSTLPVAQTENQYWFEHGVNVGQGLKAGAVIRRLTHNDSLVEVARNAVEWTQQYHGAASGVVLADERLEGLTPYYGSELCTVVETMYSMSYLYQALGDADYADKCELAAFNALPAMLTADHWAHQYVAEPNQPWSQNLAEGTPFYNVNSWGQTFGTEPNYPCCTVNHPQGLPKFLAAMFSGVGENGTEGIAHTLLGPASVKWTLSSGNDVSIQCDTNYPFDNVFTYSISAKSKFSFYIRVPAWADASAVTFKSSNPGYGSLSTNLDSSTRMQKIEVPAGDSTLMYSLPSGLVLEPRANDTVAVRYGALLYALEIGSTNTSTQPKLWNNVNATQPQGSVPEQAKDYQIFNTTAWNIAIDTSTLKYSGDGGSDLANPIFAPGAPPGKITGKGCEIEWPLYKAVPGPAPLKDQRKCIGDTIDITLRPYGSTKIRMGELPTVDLSGP
ncbi:hypothetical protein NA57DRAFT_52623 [Rhizodiscina lignyota]|uniref:Non-reducing end beta-L-arabinofuranosidase-like GH127 middle domain-containing protein n=1 Tax=Rhizodiscina lignyota TaxID=1504668 RepID=A0A9P4IPM1_9PEZI|nr:hypothetical protein NA57DRAFT_52623 [Rhizodiscina lignyota]